MTKRNMVYADSIIDLIGNTPLVRINRVIPAGSNVVLAKLEQFNPCGSVKDRPALSMLDRARSEDRLKPGSVVIEATSGNTGIALALIAAVQGYQLIIVMPESMSAERVKLLKLYGAKVELTKAHLGMRGAIERAEELHRETSGSFLVDQFNNQANPAAHETGTAEEIWKATQGEVDVVVAGVGTGGTITGVARRLKQLKPGCQIVGVEPSSSAVLSGGSSGAHMIQGIGAGFIPSIVDTALIDDLVTVSNSEAMEWSKKIIREEGILAGISSGAALRGAKKYMRKNGLRNRVIVIIFPDSGERYLSVSMFGA